MAQGFNKRVRGALKRCDRVLDLIKDNPHYARQILAAELGLIRSMVAVRVRYADPEPRRLQELFKDVVTMLTCSKEEYHFAWGRNDDGKFQPKLDWKSDQSLTAFTVGHLADMPVAVTVAAVVIDGRKILFVEPTSTVVDYDMIRAWCQKMFKKHTGRKLDRNYDISDFYTVVRLPMVTS